MMEMLAKFFEHLWHHWEWLTGLLLMIEPLIDYHVEGFRDWADKYVPRRTRSRVAFTVSSLALFIACVLAFDDQFEDWQKDEERIHGKGGYEQQLTALHAQLSDAQDKIKDQDDAISGRNGLKDQLNATSGSLSKAQDQAVYWQQHKPQVVVQTKEVPVVIPSGAVQMTPEQEQKIKNIRIGISNLLLRGQQLSMQVNNDNEASLEPQFTEWSTECVNYLTINLDQSYAVRFLDGSNSNPGITKLGISGRAQEFFMTVQSRTKRLNEIIVELSK